MRSPARRLALCPLPPQYIYIIYNIGLPSLLSVCGPILILGDNSVASSLSANGGGGADHSPRPPVPGSAENTARGWQGGAVGWQQGLAGPALPPTQAGRTRRLEGAAATPGHRQLPGNQKGNPCEGPPGPRPGPGPPLAPATHWEPRAAGPPGAEPLGIGGSSRAWALSGGRDTGRSRPLHTTPAAPVRLPRAHLRHRESPKGSGLFSPSVV